MGDTPPPCAVAPPYRRPSNTACQRAAGGDPAPRGPPAAFPTRLEQHGLRAALTSLDATATLVGLAYGPPQGGVMASASKAELALEVAALRKALEQEIRENEDTFLEM